MIVLFSYEIIIFLKMWFIWFIVFIFAFASDGTGALPLLLIIVVLFVAFHSLICFRLYSSKKYSTPSPPIQLNMRVCDMLCDLEPN